jgi:hypothetical protein
MNNIVMAALFIVFALGLAPSASAEGQTLSPTSVPVASNATASPIPVASDPLPSLPVQGPLYGENPNSLTYKEYFSALQKIIFCPGGGADRRSCK